MRYTIYIPPNTKRPNNKPNDVCPWEPAKRTGVCASKQLRFVAITETFNGNQALLPTRDQARVEILPVLFAFIHARVAKPLI